MTSIAEKVPQAAASDAIRYWEDLADAKTRQFGPVVFTTQLLDQLLELMGEKHPIHASDGFAKDTSRKQRIVPGGFIHSIVSGWIVQHGAAAAIVGLRSVVWDFVRPLYPDTPFFFTTETESAEIVDERLGLVKTVRKVFDEANRTIAIGRMNVLVQRRPAGAAQRPDTAVAAEAARQP